MSFIDIPFSNIIGEGVSNLVNGSNVTSTPDGKFAILNPGINNKIFFTTNQIDIPQNISISGVQLFLTLFSTGGTSRDVNITWQDTYFANSNAQKTQNLTTSSSSYTLGTSGTINEWGKFIYPNNFIYQELISNGLGISFNPVDTFATYFIDSVKLRLYYTTVNYLNGTRSVYVPGAPAETIPPVSNGSGLSYQVKSEQLNLIGDAICNIEQALINMGSLGVVGLATGTPNVQVLAYSMTITGTVVSNSGGLYWERYMQFSGVDGFSTTSSFNTDTIGASAFGATLFPQSGSLDDLKFVSGIGWVENSGTITPVYVAPNSLVVQNNASSQAYFISLSVFASSIASGNTSLSSDSWTSGIGIPIFGVEFSSMDSIPTGNLFIKLFAIGPISGIGGI